MTTRFSGFPAFPAFLLTCNSGLYMEEGLSAGEIAKKLILDYATLSGVLDRLAEGGWIIKETAEDDKRLLRIYLTSKAREMTKDIIRERDGLNEEVLGGLKLEEKLLLKRLLRDLQK